MSLKHPYNVVSVPAPLIVSTIYHAVLQCSTFTTVSVTRQISLQSLMVDTASCYKNDGREACWLVSSISFLPFGQSDRCTGVEFISFPWLLRCCPTRSHKRRRQDRVRPPLPTPGVTIYRSDGACRGQGTIAETLAGWSAAVWSADARGLGAGVAFATARGFLGNDYSNNQAQYFALLL